MTKLEIANYALGYVGEYEITQAQLDGTEFVSAARAINRYWDHCRDTLIRRHDWNFAKVLVQLYRQMTVNTVTSFQVGEKLVGQTSGATATIAALTGSGTVTLSLESVSGVFQPGETADAEGSSNTGNVSAVLYAEPAFAYAAKYALPSNCVRAISVNGIPLGTDQATQVELIGRELHTDYEKIDLQYLSNAADITTWQPLFLETFALSLASMITPSFIKDEGQALNLRGLAEESLREAVSMDMEESSPKVLRPIDDEPSIEARFRSGRNIAALGYTGISGTSGGTYGQA